MHFGVVVGVVENAKLHWCPPLPIPETPASLWRRTVPTELQHEFHANPSFFIFQSAAVSPPLPRMRPLVFLPGRRIFRTIELPRGNLVC